MTQSALISWRAGAIFQHFAGRNMRPTVSRLLRRIHRIARWAARYLVIGALIAIGFIGTLQLVQSLGHSNAPVKPVSAPAQSAKHWKSV